MTILQMQFLNLSDNEVKQVSDFCNWLCNVIFAKINSKINKLKIDSRLDYILYKVTWINWKSNKEKITVNQIMETIFESLTYKEYRNNIWKLEINSDILIPYSNSSIERLVRFLDYGNNDVKGMGLFSVLQNEFNHKKLNSLWQIYCMKYLHKMSNAKIISN